MILRVGGASSSPHHYRTNDINKSDRVMTTSFLENTSCHVFKLICSSQQFVDSIMLCWSFLWYAWYALTNSSSWPWWQSHCNLRLRVRVSLYRVHISIIHVYCIHCFNLYMGFVQHYNHIYIFKQISGWNATQSCENNPLDFRPGILNCSFAIISHGKKCISPACQLTTISIT